MKFTRETELYPIVKDYFTAEGFEVKAEVNSCDVMAVKQPVTIIVELKLNFNLKLVFQAMQRQALCANVYVALPDYAIDNRSKRKKDIVALMRRLGVGLIAIGKRVSGTTIEFLVNIDISQDDVDDKLMLEFESRRYDLNQGGIVKEKLVTAYRERAIAVATYLSLHGVTKAAVVKRQTNIDVAPSIMSLNHYQWFERVSRGHYQVSAKFTNDIVKYQRLYDFYIEYFSMGD